LLSKEIEIRIGIIIWFELLTRNTEVILGHTRKTRVEGLIFEPPTEWISRWFRRGCKVSCEFFIQGKDFRH